MNNYLLITVLSIFFTTTITKQNSEFVVYELLIDRINDRD